MKTRTSLVSNSSSSSFIVHYKSMWFKKAPPMLTKAQESILKENGFKLCECGHPSHLENGQDVKWITNKKQLAKAYCAGYAKSILCNQDDEIYFLVKNKIPFIADVHYGHHTYIYPKDSKCIFVFHNRGCEAETYHQDKTEHQLSMLVKDYNTYPACDKILVSQFIKKEEKWQKEYKEKFENEDTNESGEQ